MLLLLRALRSWTLLLGARALQHPPSASAPATRALLQRRSMTAGGTRDGVTDGAPPSRRATWSFDTPPTFISLPPRICVSLHRSASGVAWHCVKRCEEEEEEEGGGSHVRPHSHRPRRNAGHHHGAYASSSSVRSLLQGRKGD